jgi:hypothetical protein
MMARLIGRERTLHATRRAPAHTPDLIRYTTTRDTICGYLMGTAYRRDQHPSALSDITSSKSVIADDTNLCPAQANALPGERDLIRH